MFCVLIKYMLTHAFQVFYVSCEAWLPDHPVKPLLEQGETVVPVRLYGDEAEDHKGKSSLILTWSCACCHASTLLSRFLITMLPMCDLVAEITLNVLYEHVCWSMQVLMHGKWPHVDPYGKAWPSGSFRARLAGTPLDPLHAARAALGEFMGDWKFLKEALHLVQHYGTRLCCHECKAVHHGPGPSFADFRADPDWAATSYTHADYISDAGSEVPPLARIPGFHIRMVKPDFMHVLHLGILLWAIGSCLVTLLENGFFGNFPGNRNQRFRLQLQEAFVRFKKYCRDRSIVHSQSCFTVGMLSCDKASSWPEFKGKAANSRHVTQWLYNEMCKAGGPELELTLFGALSRCLHLIHSAAKRRCLMQPASRSSSKLAALRWL